MQNHPQNTVLIYHTDDGLTKINLYVQNGSVWLSQIAELFQNSKQNISKHIKAIFADGELDEKVVVNHQLTTTQHGAMKGKTQTRSVAYYNLSSSEKVFYRQVLDLFITSTDYVIIYRKI